MEQTAEMGVAIGEWQNALQSLVAQSGQIARLTGPVFLQSELAAPRGGIETAVTRVLVANDRVLEHMVGWLAEDDPDAQDRLFGLIYGSLVGADALNSASDSPDYVSASLRVTSTDAYPEESWLSEIESATAIVSGIHGVGGGAGASLYQPQLNDAIGRISDAAGGEVRAIATDSAMTIAVPQIPGQFAHVIGGKGGAQVLQATSKIKGAFAVAKRAAGRIVSWVVAEAHRILPSRLQQPVETVVKNIFQKYQGQFQDQIDHLIGSIAAVALGKRDVEEDWQNANSTRVIQAVPGIPGAVEEPLKRIGQVTRCRSFIDKWLSSVVSAVAKFPHMVLAIVAVAVAAIILVLYGLWRGLDQLQRLI